MKLSIILLSGLWAAQLLPAQNYDILYSFSFSDGEENVEPNCALVEGKPGTFYGVSAGNIFSITSSGGYNQLFLFESSTYTSPEGYGADDMSLFQASNGYLYGATGAGGTSGGGTVYRSDLSGNVSVVTDNVFEASPLVEGLDGNLYGIQGGITTPAIFFRMTPSGTVTTLYTFEQDAEWYGPLLLADDGNFYGVTPPVENVHGVVYRLTPDGKYSVLHAFPLGQGGTNSLMQASNGLIYGYFSNYIPATAYCKAPDGGGGFFTLSLTGAYNIINPATICSGLKEDIGPEAGFTEGSDGNIYGTTVGGDSLYGSIFVMSLEGGVQTLITFEGYDVADAQVFGPGLIQGSDGAFYGTAPGGGTSGVGVVYRYDRELAPPLPQVSVFQPRSGAVGTKVRVRGSHLVGLSGVSFNGVAAAFESEGQDFAVAAVPQGATSGPITVTTMNGSFTTKNSFEIP